MRSHHDMGGQPASAIVPAEHDFALWEKRVDAMLVLLSKKGLITVDELRRNIESLPPGAYDEMNYYERWIQAIAQTLLQRGVISVDELGRRIAALEEPAVPDAMPVQFATGDAVFVRRAAPLGHVRTPWYIRGKTGVVERICGLYANPEELAYARPGTPLQPLYRVRFRQADVWPDYRGRHEDTIDVEIYQHWLERATPREEPR